MVSKTIQINFFPIIYPLFNMDWKLALFILVLLFLIWKLCGTETEKLRGQSRSDQFAVEGIKFNPTSFGSPSPATLQVDTAEDTGDSSSGYLRANFTPKIQLNHPENAHQAWRPGRGGNWSPWRHERGNTYYYWYDAPHKSPGYECLDACYHRYDRVGCTNACRNIFNV